LVSVVLLGAGASYGSGESYPECPPLGKDLFSKLEKLGGVAANLAEVLKAAFRENFEAGMARYREEGQNIPALHRELGGYLARFTPGQKNVYGRLVKSLGVNRVVYCSLNYDLMLELAAGKIGFPTQYSPEFVDSKNIRIIKPHGSSNFWLDLNFLALKGVKISGCEHDFEGPVRPLPHDETLMRCDFESELSPAISMYAEGKEVYTCPGYVTEHRKHWENVAAKASRIFVVGVRVHTVDDHIWGVLAKSKAHVTYFGISDNDEHEFHHWMKTSNKRNARYITADFAGSIPHMSRLIYNR
jgi:hypothetical protein